MNKYHIQIENHATGFWDWITVYSHSDEYALSNAKTLLHKYQDQMDNCYSKKYQGYEVSHIFSIEKDCEPPSNYDILTQRFLTEEDNEMAFFKVNWNNYTEQLSKLAATEPWSNGTYPNNGILANYLIHTFEKLKSENNIITTNEYGLFNTGLFTSYYEPIYAYQKGTESVKFLTSYELGSLGIENFPGRANYFEKPELLLFDWHYQINVYYKHILDNPDNRERIPDDILKRKDIINTLNGSIDTMKKRVSANYKLAVPQYFNGQIQLLLPLCLQTDDTPDLALVVTKTGNYYQGHTCITLDMAYNNARLIAKPESTWLIP